MYKQTQAIFVLFPSTVTSETGRSNFGKVKINWTTRAPCYDMDFTLLNKQRVRPVRCNRQMTMPVPVKTTTHCKKRNSEQHLLPSLFKRRLSNTHENWRRKLHVVGTVSSLARNVIRLPPLSGHSSRLSLSNSTVSSDSHKDPPPPPNTAELCKIDDRLTN